MATAVTARQQGDDYQARIFWLEACRLFPRRSKVARVAFELDRIRAFDDVVVTYSTQLPDERGEVYSVDYYQAKYHVDAAGSLTANALIDPKAIGASSVSLLQRLHTAVQASTSSPARFHLISAWGVHPDDGLAEVVSNRFGELRLDKLFDGTTDASSRGKIRKAWRKHLKLKTDEELQAVVAPLRIQAPYRNLETLRKELNVHLRSAGLCPVDDACQGHQYDDLIRKLHGNGVNDFDRATLKKVCEGEGLWVGDPVELSDRTPIGIRSFFRFAEHLEDETDHLLCLLKHFDGRRPIEKGAWGTAIGPEVKRFLERTTDRNGRYLLFLDAHSSIALLAGQTLDTKSGVDVAIVQRGAGRTAVWEPHLTPPSGESAVSVREEVVNPDGKEIAVALGVSNPVGVDVLHYVRQQLPGVSKVVIVEAIPRPSQTAVRDAAHAFQIAEECVHAARAHRPPEATTLHFFSSAPNTVLFYLGRLSPGLGRMQAYEFLFEEGKTGAYEPSVTLPIP